MTPWSTRECFRRGSIEPPCHSNHFIIFINFHVSNKLSEESHKVKTARAVSATENPSLPDSFDFRYGDGFNPCELFNLISRRRNVFLLIENWICWRWPPQGCFLYFKLRIRMSFLWGEKERKTWTSCCWFARKTSIIPTKHTQNNSGKRQQTVFSSRPRRTVIDLPLSFSSSFLNFPHQKSMGRSGRGKRKENWLLKQKTKTASSLMIAHLSRPSSHR